MRAATPATTAKSTTTLDCLTEQAAARVLGYTQEKWDNPENIAIQPDSFDKGWDELTAREQVSE